MQPRLALLLRELESFPSLIFLLFPDPDGFLWPLLRDRTGIKIKVGIRLWVELSKSRGVLALIFRFHALLAWWSGRPRDMTVNRFDTYHPTHPQTVEERGLTKKSGPPVGVPA